MLYKYRVEFMIGFSRYAEVVEARTRQQARELIMSRYPEANIKGVTELWFV